jgi:hypothetical protein
LKNPTQKKAGGVAQGVGPEFKSQYHKRKKKNYVKIPPHSCENGYYQEHKQQQMLARIGEKGLRECKLVQPK